MAVIYSNKVNNDQGAPALFESTLASFPTTHVTGRLLVATDTFALYRDNGTGYDLIGGPGTGTVTGSGASGQVVYWSGASTVTGNNAFFWDAVNQRLGIGTATPTSKLDIHGASATLAILNNTGTANSLLSFQNQNTNKWRVGNSYNASANDFVITDVTASIDVITVSNFLTKVTLNYDTTVSGSITANSLIKSGGTSLQFLKADGSVDSSSYISNSGLVNGQVLFATSASAAGGSTSFTWDSVNGRLKLGSAISSTATFQVGGSVECNGVIQAGGVFQTNGTLSVTPGASFTVIDHAGNDARLFTYGSNASTNGSFSLISKKSNGTGDIIFQTFDTLGACTLSSTLGINGVADNVKSGTYTPTVTGTANVSANTPLQCQYIRVGNVVTVSGSVLITPSAANTTTTFTMSLPITSNFSAVQSCGGAGNWTAGTTPANYTTAISAQTGTPGTAFFSFYSDTLLGSRFIPFSFTYIIE